MSLKSLSAEIPKFKPTKKFKIQTTLRQIIHTLNTQSYSITTFQDLITCMDINHLNPNDLNLPYDYPTLKKDILSGKYDNEHVYSDIDIEKLKQKIENGEIQGTIRS